MSKERRGEKQRIELDLRRGYCHVDPDLGMTLSLNWQVCLIISVFVFENGRFDLI